MYCYKYLLLWDILYIIRNSLVGTFHCKFNCANLSSHSWDISKQSFYSYWWPDISVVCCHFYTSCICADSSYLGLSSATYFVKISLLVVEISVEWSLWQYVFYKANMLLLCYMTLSVPEPSITFSYVMWSCDSCDIDL